MSTRNKGREVALQMLFAHDINPDMRLDALREMVCDELKNPALQAFAWSLVTGVLEFRRQLDEQIEAVAQNWTIRRMAPTDRNVLRLGLYELLHTKTPHRVVLDEAIELARRFGGATSPQFVNGILDRLIPDDRRDRPPSPENTIESESGNGGETL